MSWKFSAVVSLPVTLNSSKLCISPHKSFAAKKFWVFGFALASFQNHETHAICMLYLDLLDIYIYICNVCLLVGFFGEKAQILHTWKIQVYNTHSEYQTYNAWIANWSFAIQKWASQTGVKIKKHLCTPPPTLPETNSKRIWKWMVGSIFSGMVSGMAYWKNKKTWSTQIIRNRNGPAWRQACERSRILNWDPMTWSTDPWDLTHRFYLRENQKKSTISWIGKQTIYIYTIYTIYTIVTWIRHGIWNLGKSMRSNHLSHEKNPVDIPWNPGWLIGILVVVHYPHLLGRMSSPISNNQPGFFHCSPANLCKISFHQ